MSDRETATFDLTKGEARVVIAALAEAELTASDDRERHVRNVQDHLAAEFEFDEYRGSDEGEMTGDDESWFDKEWFDDGVLGDDTEEIELSREEAEAVTDALEDFELDAPEENAYVAEDVRERFLDAFGPGTGDRGR